MLYAVVFYAEGKWQVYNSYTRKSEATRKANILRVNGYRVGVAHN